MLGRRGRLKVCLRLKPVSASINCTGRVAWKRKNTLWATRPPNHHFSSKSAQKKIMLPRPCTQPLHRHSPEDAATKYEPEYEQLFTISFKQVLYFSKYHQFTAWFITRQNNESCTIWFLFYIVLRWLPHFILHNCPSACFPILCPAIPDFASFVFVKKTPRKCHNQDRNFFVGAFGMLVNYQFIWYIFFFGNNLQLHRASTHSLYPKFRVRLAISKVTLKCRWNDTLSKMFYKYFSFQLFGFMSYPPAHKVRVRLGS